MEKNFFNPELNREDTYTEVWLPEKVTVKDEQGLSIVNHYWQDNSGKLWTDFDHPMENVYRAFAAYRKRKKYMSAAQIKNLRKKLGLSVREFADNLGISSDTLIQIENNHKIQTEQQERLFENALNDQK